MSELSLLSIPRLTTRLAIASVDFACLIIQATAYQLHDKRTQRLLSTSLQHPAGRSLPDLKRACRAILARYPLASQDAADLGVTLLLLLKDLLLQTEQQSSPRDFTSLKTFLFAEHPVLMGWRTLPPPSNSVRTGKLNVFWRKCGVTNLIVQQLCSRLLAQCSNQKMKMTSGLPLITFHIFTPQKAPPATAQRCAYLNASLYCLR